MLIERKSYLDRLVSLKDNGRVKIITGIRRCGKSFLLKNIYRNYLLENGVDDNDILYISLDDVLHNSLLNPLQLDSFVRERCGERKTYVFIDEIQMVFDIVNPIFTNGKVVPAKRNEENKLTFVNVVLGLMQLENIDLYITGSNSRFLSRDIMTEFRDRGDEVHVQPLCFNEFYPVCGIDDVYKSFDEFMAHGGMPLTLSYVNSAEKERYLDNLLSLTYIKDVVERNKIRNESALETLCKVMASNVGNLINPTRIANTFATVEKLKIDKLTIDNYLKYLEDAFVIKKVNRLDIRGNGHIGGTYKYYFTDTGLRNALLDFNHLDQGHVMENILFNELTARGFSVEVGSIDVYYKNSKGTVVRNVLEADFVATKGSTRYYIQSSFNIGDEEKIEQERKSLININDSFKKIIVTADHFQRRIDEKGILYINVCDFLLDKDLVD